MSRSRFDHRSDNQKSPKANRKTYDVEDEEEECIHRKSKKSGKRFHRKKTIRDEFLDDLMGKG